MTDPNHNPAKRGEGLEVSHLRKSYGDLVAVDDLSFRVRPGEILGLIGPNGAGKSTCMMVIIGLLKPDAGTIKLNGQPYDASNREMRSHLGIVPQELAIYPELTARQNLRFFGSLYGLRGQRLDKQVDYVLDLTGLTRNADHTPSTFSGGMCRRLNFGIALLHEPRFVILDEPTVGIDPQSRTNLLDCIRQLSAKGVGVLYASHYMEEIEAVCHRVAIIDHGRLLQQGTLDELLDRSQAELSIRIGEIPSDVVAKLQSMATLQQDADGTTRVLVRENLSTQKQVRLTEMQSVMEVLGQADVPILGIETHEISLETLFLRLTGRKLRD
jgi:ABC-2 type transport system ATP-binding protein